MKNTLSWTERLPDGVKRETRVRVSLRAFKWQFKRADQEQWDYDHTPTAEDWDMLENFMTRKAARGKAPKILDAIKTIRAKAGL